MVSVSEAQNLDVLRKNFHRAIIDRNEAEEFYQCLKEYDKRPVILAYKAVSEALMAGEGWNPFDRISHLSAYESSMNDAVMMDVDNIEIRFLRFATEYNIPKILRMSDHLMEDLEMIVKNIDALHALKLDRSFTNYILYFLNDTKLCSDEQIAIIENQLSASLVMQ